jgi:ubiquinone/menaquinone biosynthesis C-methylase UbiE
MEFENINVLNVYENIANKFSEKRFNTWDWIEHFINKLPVNSHILDIGCGNGRNMTISSDKYKYTGVDNCSNFVKLAKNINPNVFLSDMVELPFHDNYFDAIISIASFHHLSTIDRRIKCLNEMKRVLKPNGKLLLSIWSINQSHNKKLNNTFNYGNNMVPWKDNKGHIIDTRYYYIFELDEIYQLLQINFNIESHDWNFGNEIFCLNV